MNLELPENWQAAPDCAVISSPIHDARPHTSVYRVVTGGGEDRQREICSSLTDQENSTIRLLRVTTDQFGADDHHIQLYWRSHFPQDGLYRPCSLIALRANQPHSSQLAGEEDAGGVGRNGRCAEWEIDSTVLRPEPRLDHFDGARGLTGIGADTVAMVHQTDPLCLSRAWLHVPDRLRRKRSSRYRCGCQCLDGKSGARRAPDLPSSAQRGQ